jgi:hypothetical protein
MFSPAMQQIFALYVIWFFVVECSLQGRFLIQSNWVQYLILWVFKTCFNIVAYWLYAGTVEPQRPRGTRTTWEFGFVSALVHISQELLSHRGLGARGQRENCGLYRRVARRQLCERLDCATESASDITYHHWFRCCATLGKHAWQQYTYLIFVAEQQCVFYGVRQWAIGWFLSGQDGSYITRVRLLSMQGQGTPVWRWVEYLHRDPASRRR